MGEVTVASLAACARVGRSPAGEVATLDEEIAAQRVLIKVVQDAAVAGGALAAAAGKYPPSFHPAEKLPPLDPTPGGGFAPPAHQGDPSLLLPPPTQQLQEPKFFLMKKDWMKGHTPKERLAANFYSETVMQFNFFDYRQRDEFQHVCAPIDKMYISDDLIKDWHFF